MQSLLYSRYRDLDAHMIHDTERFLYRNNTELVTLPVLGEPRTCKSQIRGETKDRGFELRLPLSQNPLPTLRKPLE